MLRSLSIAHFALIERLEVDFSNGLNIITGETGAGKSIIIDAFLAALGERTSTDMIRRGSQRAVIEAVFELETESPVHSFLRVHDCEDLGATLIVRRELSAKGSSRCFINDSPTQLALLRELGTMLVDFHGQYEHQSILRAEFQVRMVDELAQSAIEFERYQDTYRELRTVLQTYRTLRTQEEEYRARQDFQRAQLDEIERIDPRADEDVELERELSILSNAELLFAQSDAAYRLLYGADASARDGLIKVREHLQHLRDIDARFADSCAELESVIISVEELAKSVKQYSARIEFQPGRIEEIRERLSMLQRLRKRYGSLEKCLELRQRLAEELSFIENVDERTKQFELQIADLRKQLGKHAIDLSKKRLGIVQSFAQSIVDHLSELGIEHARFECRVNPIEMSSAGSDDELYAVHAKKYYRSGPTGVDQVQFLASMNKGEELKALDKVLSGGEASRLMLALKSVLAAADNIPLVVFDEIDTGVSGRIARRVGMMMRTLASSHQVIAITHQAQIASLGSEHIAVSKEDGEGSTRILARRLNAKERVHEVAKLISGETVTTTSLKSARELMEVGE